MKHNKICFAIHCIGHGGAERVVSILCSRFAEKGYDVHLICNHQREWEYPISPLVTRHIIGEDVSCIRPVASYQRISRMRRICKREEFDVLIAFMSMNEYSVFATYGMRTKNVISTRLAPEVLYNTFFKRTFARLLLSTASGAVFQTVAAQKWFPARLQQKSIVIFNPIASEFYDVPREPIEGRIVATGRLVRQKNYPLMLEAFAFVAQSHGVKLVICGKGEELDDLKARTDRLGISDIVTFCGQCDDVPSALSKADIYLLTSDYEGLPNALMEAMAVGVPCVATDCLGGGSRLLMGDSERGMLVPRGESRKIAEAIISLLDNPELKLKLASSAKEFAGCFSVDSCFQEWERYINSFID